MGHQQLDRVRRVMAGTHYSPKTGYIHACYKGRFTYSHKYGHQKAVGNNLKYGEQQLENGESTKTYRNLALLPQRDQSQAHMPGGKQSS